MRICKRSLISAAVLLLGATLFVGCSMQDGSFDDMVYEADNSAIQLSSSFAKIDNTVYFVERVPESGQSVAMYADLESGQNGVLCGKAECQHDNPSCNAYIGFQAIGFSAYGGKLYWMAEKVVGEEFKGKYLYCMDADGSNRKELRKIAETDSDVLPDGNTYAFFHRGYFVIGGVRTSMKQNQYTSKGAIYAFSLKNPKEDQAIFEDDIGADVSLLYLQADKEKLYYSYSEKVNEEEYRTRIVVWDLAEKTGEILYEKVADFGVWRFAQDHDKGRILMTASGENDDRVFEIDLKTKELKESFHFAPEIEAFSNLDLLDGKVVGYTYPGLDQWDFSKRHILIRDYDGNIVNERLETETMRDENDSWVYGRILNGADKENLYYQYNVMDNSGDSFFVAIPMNGDTERILWSSRE